MRMSCNGCRVLRKGCSENCSIRPCLQWIKTPESQANATVFLAKFYGRAGLMNLINSGPEHLRPAIFRSLLYEACGRIVNPIYGSVGLLWSGSWQLCQSAVEAVLKGAPIVQIPSEQATVNTPNLHPLIKAYDIRHVTKEEQNDDHHHQDHHPRDHQHHHHKVTKTRSRGIKRSSSSSSSEAAAVAAAAATLANAKRMKNGESTREWSRREASHESSTTDDNNNQKPQVSEPNSRETQTTESMFSVETVEASLVSRAVEAKKSEDCQSDGGDQVELELTLGFETTSRVQQHHHNHRAAQVTDEEKKRRIDGGGFDTCKMELGLDYPS